MTFEELLAKYKIKYTDIEGAFVHSSIAKIKYLQNNERLEFVGDSIFNLAVSLWLFEQKKSNEGKMSKARSRLVSTKNLAYIFDQFELEIYLKISHQASEKIKANTVEAIVAAVFFALKKDFLQTARFIYDFVIKNSKTDIKDYKTLLQEKLQKNPPFLIEYFTHAFANKVFEAAVSNNNKVLARGQGKSKKEAEQNAAKEALNEILAR